MKNEVYARKPLGNKRFKWKQRDFVLSTFNCLGEDVDMAIRHCKEVGFNLLELGWGRHDKVWEAVDKCEKYGIDLVFQDFSLFGGMMNRHDDRHVDDNVIRETAKFLKEKKHTVGYYVWDEPHRDYLFKEARRQSDILLECDSDALMFSVFPPSYNSGPTWDNGQYYDAFEEYVKVLEPPVLSMDYYPVGDYGDFYGKFKYTDEMQLDNSPIWLDLAVARNLAKKYDLPLWFYYQNCHVYNTEKLEFPMVRAMMYVGALYGAKGLQSFTATGTTKVASDNENYPRKETVLLATGEKGEFFDQQKEIHEEFEKLGNTLMALSNKAVYHSSDVMPFGRFAEIYKNFEDDIAKSDILASNLPKRTSVGELCDEYGNDYIFVLNRDFNKKLDTQIQLKGKFNIYEVSRKDGLQYLLSENVDSLNVNLDCGDAILFRVQKSDEELCAVSYICEE